MRKGAAALQCNQPHSCLGPHDALLLPLRRLRIPRTGGCFKTSMNLGAIQQNIDRPRTLRSILGFKRIVAINGKFNKVCGFIREAGIVPNTGRAIGVAFARLADTHIPLVKFNGIEQQSLSKTATSQ